MPVQVQNCKLLRNQSYITVKCLMFNPFNLISDVNQSLGQM